MGRYKYKTAFEKTIWKNKKVKDKMREMLKDGVTILKICESFNISPSTFYRWKSIYPEFEQFIIDCRTELTEEIKETLYKKAKGYKIELKETTETPDGEIIVKTKEQFIQSDQAMKMALSTLDPLNFGLEKQKLRAEIELIKTKTAALDDPDGAIEGALVTLLDAIK
jgi:transposase-like protein